MDAISVLALLWKMAFIMIRILEITRFIDLFNCVNKIRLRPQISRRLKSVPKSVQVKNKSFKDWFSAKQKL